MAFLTDDELSKIGIKKIGRDVKISDKASFYGVEHLEIGDYSRIDDFCIISAGLGGIQIGRNVHIACYSSLIGKESIRIDDFANISSRVSIYSSNDDYSGSTLSNPTIPEKYKAVQNEEVFVGKHVIIGSGSIVLPGISIGNGTAVGALSLVKTSFEGGLIIAGIPAKSIKRRKTTLLDLEGRYLSGDF